MVEYMKTCLYCGNQFVPVREERTGRMSKFCDQTCRAENWLKKHREQAARRKAGTTKPQPTIKGEKS